VKRRLICVCIALAGVSKTVFERVIL
jgi:hypothetical protein